MTKIVILAAGKGTRMKQSIPKVLTKLKGLEIIKYLLNTVVDSNIDNKPLIIVSKDNRKIIEHNLKDYNLDYFVQKEQLGTGDAVKSALEYINSDIEKVIVLYGDHPFIKKESLIKLNNLNIESVAIMPIIVKDFEDWRFNTYHWGRIVRNKNNEIKEIIEFKDANEKQIKIKELNPGIMAFNYLWLRDNINKLNNNNAKKEYYLTDLIKVAVENGKKVESVKLDERESIGINSQEELKLAELLIN